jgi:peroxiredoxin
MMNRRSLILAGAAVAAFAQAPPPVKTHLKAGDAAPDFELTGTDGKKYTLSQFKSDKVVVLAFFPAAFTGGCTKEMTAYTGDIQKFQDAGAQVFGVSTDSLPSLRHWADEHIQATFPMLSDFSERKATKAYGILMPNGMASRTTFVIDRDGKIQHIDEGATAVDISGAAMACSRLKK